MSYILLLWAAESCNQRAYTLTIMSSRPDGTSRQEVHRITASTDSVAYARAATTYLLAAHAYRMMMDNAKPYISKPVKFLLIDENGKNIDSVLGGEKAEMIRKKLDSAIN